MIPVGALVKICNHEHIWHGQIGIVRNVKDIKFYRVELLGKLVWMPQHWLTVIEDDND
jgi:hypothetical protein